jgi:predicted transcriptional regulator
MPNLQRNIEDKLIILYVLDKIKTGMSREQIALVVIQNVQISYFDIQLYIDAMVREHLIAESTDSDGIAVFMNTSEGTAAIRQLSPRIPVFIREMLDRYIQDCQNKFLNAVSVTADYTENGPGDFQTELSLTENGLKLMALSVNCPSRDEAVAMCDKWKKQTQKIYAAIIRDLT